MNLKGKVVVVTGAGAGIGAATAKMFAKEGAYVVLADINNSSMRKVGNEIKERYTTPLLITADVTKAEDTANIIDQTLEKYGKLDILVNNAGILKLGNILSKNLLEVYDKVIDTNLRSVVRLTKLAIPHLIRSKGNIVNVSSISAAKNCKSPLLMPYSISKIGVEQFSKEVARELAPHGVRVNAVSPGSVLTKISGFVTSARLIFSDPSVLATPMRKFAKTDELAGLICFIASDKGKGMTGSVYVCDNGLLLK